MKFSALLIINDPPQCPGSGNGTAYIFRYICVHLKRKELFAFPFDLYLSEAVPGQEIAYTPGGPPGWCAGK